MNLEDETFLALFASDFQTACQDQDDEEDEDEDGDQAEYDAMLIEYAGDIIPSLARALGGVAFAPYFAGTLPLLIARTVSDRTHQT